MTFPRCLFADPPPDLKSETKSEDELPLWEMRDRRTNNNDEGPAADPNDAQQHEDRDMLHSKMQAYTDLVFEDAKQTVKPHGEEKVLGSTKLGVFTSTVETCFC